MIKLKNIEVDRFMQQRIFQFLKTQIFFNK